METTSQMPSGARQYFHIKEIYPGSCSGKGEKRSRWKCWHHAVPLVQRGFASLHTCITATALTQPSFMCIFSPYPRLQEQVWKKHPKLPHCLKFCGGNSSKQDRTKRVSVEAWSTCACTKVCMHHLPLGFCSQHREHRMLSPVVLVHAHSSFFFLKRISHCFGWIHCFVKWKWQERWRLCSFVIWDCIYGT